MAANEAQQRQIAQAAAEARGESAPEAAPSGVQVRVKPSERPGTFYEFEFGKAHGFSADYSFTAANHWTQTLTAEDAEELRARGDHRFTFLGGA